MQKFTVLKGVAAPLPMVNVDTDAIIPKQFLKTIERSGLGKFLFNDLRFTPEGKEKPEFVLNREPYRHASILVAGDNFGCGSSREHAPWALVGYGFKAVISTFFADIFRSNSLKNGLLPIIVDPETHEQIMSMAEEDPTTTVTIDLANQRVILPDGRGVSFPIDAFTKHCLLNGVDQMGFLLGEDPAIKEFEEAHEARVATFDI